jgi:hypothetical protein
MPGGTGGEFGTLEQNTVFPTELGEMIEDGATDNSATYDDGLCV